MKLGTIAWNADSTAVLIDERGRAFAVRALAARDDARDVAALIARPLTRDELLQIERSEPIDAPRFLPPILRPPKNVLCVGKNYVEHVHEGARAEGVRSEIPTAPIWFTKAHTALVGDDAAINHDPAFTEQLDYEAELAVVIGATCRNVTKENAFDYIFGYTILNDVTARDVQQARKQWFRGKSADTYAPCGPWVVTSDEIPDPQDLTLRTIVNGEVRQSDSTRNMIFDVRTLIADLTAAMTLEPGDLIATGTPSGVAWGMAEPKYLVPGDRMIVEIERIGALRSTVVGC